MNWQDVTGKAARSVAHWQKLGQFRARHPAIGMGKQTTLSLPQGYGFVREHNGDKVMVVWAAISNLTVTLSRGEREPAEQSTT
jgi:alpha-amylase